MRLGTNMTPWGFVSLLTLAGSAVAELNFTNWQPPQPSDFRSPCPAMNSLANHNFIQHDGRNITIESLVPVLQQVFHLSEELATIVSRLGLFTAKDPSQGVFTLEDLNTHNLFEHDASLSRADFYDGGDAHTFRQDIFDKFISHFDGMEFVTLEAAALARYSMVLDSRKNNPTFAYGVQHQITSYGETIKYFRTIVDPETEKCPVAWVKILFQEQRLPYLEGWRPPKTEISGFSMASDVLQLALVTPEKNN